MHDYPQASLAETPKGLRIRMPSIRERLIDKKANLESSLQEVNEAIKMLDENPAFEKVQDAIAKAGY